MVYQDENKRRDYNTVALGSAAVGVVLPLSPFQQVILQAIDGETMTSPTTMSPQLFFKKRIYIRRQSSFYSWHRNLVCWPIVGQFSLLPNPMLLGLYEDGGDTSTFLSLKLNCSTEVTGGSNMTNIRNSGIWNMPDDPTLPNIPNASSMGLHIDEPGAVTDVTSVVAALANATQGRTNMGSDRYAQLFPVRRHRR